MLKTNREYYGIMIMCSLNRSNINVRSFSFTEKNSISTERVMIIGAHHDDAPIMAFPAIWSSFLRGDKAIVDIVVSDSALTTPRPSLYSGISKEDIREVRQDEELDVARKANFGDLILMNQPSHKIRELREDSITKDLLVLINKYRPIEVWCHNPFDRHPTHVALFVRTVEACLSLPPDQRPRRLIGGEVWGSIEWIQPPTLKRYDVSGGQDLASQLLALYHSQNAARRYNEGVLGRWAANATFAEPRDLQGNLSHQVVAVDLKPLIAASPEPIEIYIKREFEKARELCRNRLDGME